MKAVEEQRSVHSFGTSKACATLAIAIPQVLKKALAAEGRPLTEVLIVSTHVKVHYSAAGEKGARTFRRSASAGAAATPRPMLSPNGRADRSPSC